MFEKITNKTIKECTDSLDFYDENGRFPWDRKRVSLTLSYKAIEKLQQTKNKSNFVDNLINS